jgi:hypothetical protein
MEGPGVAPPMVDPAMGGGPQDEVGQLLELRNQIDMRLMELGVPPEAMAAPDFAPPVAPPIDPMAAMGGGGMPIPPGGPAVPPQMPPGLLG